VSLRIACDLDGTVADMDRALLSEAERLFGPGVTLRSPVRPAADEGKHEAPDTASTVSRPANNPRTLTTRELRTLWSHVRKIDNFWTTLDEIESGTVRRLADLAAAHRWHVLFMTRRPQTRGESAQRQSQRWLEERGYPLPAVCVVSHSRGRLAGLLELHAVIDDRPETCLDVVADSKAVSILVWRGDEPVPPGVTGLGVRPVSSFQGALEHLEELATATRSPGFLRRIKSALRPG
jgi:hypothetical protein